MILRIINYAICDLFSIQLYDLDIHFGYFLYLDYTYLMFKDIGIGFFFAIILSFKYFLIKK